MADYFTLPKQGFQSFPPLFFQGNSLWCNSWFINLLFGFVKVAFSPSERTSWGQKKQDGSWWSVLGVLLRIYCIRKRPKLRIGGRKMIEQQKNVNGQRQSWTNRQIWRNMRLNYRGCDGASCAGSNVTHSHILDVKIYPECNPARLPCRCNGLLVWGFAFYCIYTNQSSRSKHLFKSLVKFEQMSRWLIQRYKIINTLIRSNIWC